MKRKTGVVVKIDKNYVCVRTVKGEFFNLRIQGNPPKIGDIYSAPIVTSKSIAVRRTIFICVTVSAILFGKNIYSYFTPSTTIIMNIPPTIQLKVNKWNKIVHVKPTRSSGRNLLESLDLKNLTLNKGLEIITEEAIRKDIINEAYTSNTNNKITLYISSNSGQDIDLSSFLKYIEDRKIKHQVNYDGTDLSLIEN